MVVMLCMNNLQTALDDLTTLGEQVISHEYSVNGKKFELTGPAICHKDLIVFVTNKVAATSILEKQIADLESTLLDKESAIAKLSEMYEEQVRISTVAFEAKDKLTKRIDEFVTKVDGDAELIEKLTDDLAVATDALKEIDQIDACQEDSDCSDSLTACGDHARTALNTIEYEVIK